MINKFLMKIGLKEKDLDTYLESTDFIEKVVTENEYTVTVVEDNIWYIITGWKNGKNAHTCIHAYPKSNEKDTVAMIDKYVDAILSVMKKYK